MARRKQQQGKAKYACRHCRHSCDWHEKNWQGEPFLCRCPHYKAGKFSKFLDDPQCNLFEMKKHGSAE